MSDATTGDETPGTGADAPKPRPTPNPASRARRIGGRPTPRPTPSPSPKSADQVDVGTAAETPTDASEATAAPKPKATPKPKSAPKPKAAPKAAKADPKPTADPTPARLSKTAVQAGPADEPRAKSGGRALPLRWLPANLLALAALVLAVFVAIESHGVYWAKSDDSASAVTKNQEQVLAAAKQCFHVVTSYDYRKLANLVATDTACTTGTFKTQLAKSLNTQIIPNAPKQKAVQSAQVNRAGIVSVSADGKQVVVMIYAQLSLSNNTTAKDSRVDVLGAVATMDKVGGTWLISNLDTDVGNSLGG